MSPTPLSGWRWPYIHYWKYMRLLSAVHQGHRGSPSPTCCKNHVPRPPLPLVSPRSGNRVNPLEGPQSVSGSGEAHTKERNTPISPSPITNTTPPLPHLSYCHVSLASPPFTPPLKFRVMIITCTEQVNPKFIFPQMALKSYMENKKDIIQVQPSFFANWKCNKDLGGSQWMEVFEPSPTGHGGHQEALGMPSIDTIGPTSSASKWSPAPFLFLKKKTATASLKCHHTRKNEDSSGGRFVDKGPGKSLLLSTLNRIGIRIYSIECATKQHND